jgi:hypothetical protein
VTVSIKPKQLGLLDRCQLIKQLFYWVRFNLLMEPWKWSLIRPFLCQQLWPFDKLFSTESLTEWASTDIKWLIHPYNSNCRLILISNYLPQLLISSPSIAYFCYQLSFMCWTLVPTQFRNFFPPKLCGI